VQLRGAKLLHEPIRKFGKGGDRRCAAAAGAVCTRPRSAVSGGWLQATPRRRPADAWSTAGTVARCTYIRQWRARLGRALTVIWLLVSATDMHAWHEIMIFVGGQGPLHALFVGRHTLQGYIWVGSTTPGNSALTLLGSFFVPLRRQLNAHCANRRPLAPSRRQTLSERGSKARARAVHVLHTAICLRPLYTSRSQGSSAPPAPSIARQMVSGTEEVSANRGTGCCAGLGF
jgi:hypothetical protein